MPSMKTRALMVFAAGLTLLSSCARQESAREIDWAKAALARNPAYEIVATDEARGIFTVRNTSTGGMETLKLEDLIATPAPAKTAARPASPPPAAPEATPTPDASPAESPTPASEPIETPKVAAAQTTVDKAAPGQPLAEGPGYSIARGEDDAANTAAAAPKTLEGPGYSITRHEAAPPRPAPAAPLATSSERRTDPIICQGDRLMRIDDETMEFTGDAVIAEKGCDLYISNAKIRAGGIGIIARQARVHIVNSTIGGTQASYEVSDGAELYVARSTFSGVGRRFDTAQMNDLGGNAYQTR